MGTLTGLKTENCIVCGNKATVWHGHVRAKQKMAIGNYIEKKVVAGFCEKHAESLTSDASGCYGQYNYSIMGECIPLKFK